MDQECRHNQNDCFDTPSYHGLLEALHFFTNKTFRSEASSDDLEMFCGVMVGDFWNELLKGLLHIIFMGCNRFENSPLNVDDVSVGAGRAPAPVEADTTRERPRPQRHRRVLDQWRRQAPLRLLLEQTLLLKLPRGHHELVRKEKLMGGDLSVAIQAATELRDRIEIVHTTGYLFMLAALLPAFCTLLSKSIPPQFGSSSWEQRWNFRIGNYESHAQ